MMDRREFFEPKTIQEACELLSEKGDEARIIAGGQTLMALIRNRAIKPKFLVSLRLIPDLNTIEYRDGQGLSIGAAATHRDVERSDVIKEHCPVISEMAGVISDVQIRNAGTIGGSLYHADPDSDPAPVLLSLKSSVVAASANGERTISLDDFFVGYFESALLADEVLTEIRVPEMPPNSGSAYRKFTIREGDYGITNAAASVFLDSGGVCQDARLVISSVAFTPVRAKEAEGKLIGSVLGEDVIRDAAETAAQEIEPIGDPIASAEYKRHLVGVISRYALEEAAKRASDRNV